MTRLHPVSGYLVAGHYATRVVGPAYDELTADQRREVAAVNPLSFLNVTRSQADLPPGLDPATCLLESAERLRVWIEDGVFAAEPEPAFYVYRLEVSGHVQTGVVGDLPVESLHNGTVRRHETTLPQKEEELVAFLETVRVNSSPVALTYRPRPATDRITPLVVQNADPVLDFTTADGVRHLIWRAGGEAGAALIEAFSDVTELYITDGHHRAAAAARFAASRPEAGRVLGVLFPADQLRILPYNRCLTLVRSELPDLVARRFQVDSVPSYEEARPTTKGQFAMFAGGRWSRLTRLPQERPPASSVEDLDVSVLHREVLAPLLEVASPDYDPRLSYVPGVGGPRALEARCAATGEIGFVLRPTAIEEVMAVADAGETMPPKSTWFHPKARSGLFVVPR